MCEYIFLTGSYFMQNKCLCKPHFVLIKCDNKKYYQMLPTSVKNMIYFCKKKG